MGATFALNNGAVHIWSVYTDRNNDDVEALRPLLSREEQLHAARFRFLHLARNWIVARGTLRLLLGRYLSVAPDAIVFAFGAKGKPFLSPPSELQFNVSHSGSLAVYAFTYGCELGIDVEEIRPLPDLHDIALRFFCSEEVNELFALPPDQQTNAFFSCWTRKEACIKAVGDGLSAPLDSFRVSLCAGEAPRFIHIGHNAELARQWSLHNLDFGSSYAGALAYHAAPLKLISQRIELWQLLKDAHKKTG